MVTTFYLRWMVPAASSGAVPQFNGMVLAISPEYTPIDTSGGGMEQATEVFNPSFAKTAQSFPRGQRVFQFPLKLSRNYRDAAAANGHKAGHLLELPPSDVRLNLYCNSVGALSGINSWGLLNCVLKSVRWTGQNGSVLEWEYLFEGGTLEQPLTTGYTASMIGSLRRFNST